MFIPATYALTKFDLTSEVDLLEKPFMRDLTSFRVGAVRLRQNRVRPG